MSDRSSARKDAWRPWQMGALERRMPRRNTGEGEDAPARRREDGISFALFELAKEEAVAKGHEAGYAQGLEQGRAEAKAEAKAEHEQRLAAELDTLLAPIRELSEAYRAAVNSLNDKVSYELVELALEAGLRHRAAVSPVERECRRRLCAGLRPSGAGYWPLV